MVGEHVQVSGCTGAHTRVSVIPTHMMVVDASSDVDVAGSQFSFGEGERDG